MLERCLAVPLKDLLGELRAVAPITQLQPLEPDSSNGSRREAGSVGAVEIAVVAADSGPLNGELQVCRRAPGREAGLPPVDQGDASR